MFFSGSLLKDELLKSSSGVYFTFSPTVLQVEQMWPKYVATREGRGGGEKEKKSLHLSLQSVFKCREKILALMYAFKNLPQLTLAITTVSSFITILLHSDHKFY